MATVDSVLEGIALSIRDMTDQLSAPNPVVFVDMPSTEVMGNLARVPAHSLVSVFDDGFAENVSRWNKIQYSDVIMPIGISSVVSRAVIPASSTATITISGTVLANDAVSAVISFNAIIAGLDPTGEYPIKNVGTAFSQTTQTTTAQMATGLAAKINADTRVNAFISAVAVGSVVTVTNLLVVPMNFRSKCGNIGSRTTEVARSKRSVQIIIWSTTRQERSRIGNAIMGWLGNRQANFGIALDDGSYARLMYAGDKLGKDTHMHDIYQWNIKASAEFGITYTETLYSVLVAEMTKRVGVDVP